MPPDPGKTQLSPTAMTLRDAARLLSKVGGEPVTEEMLQADVDGGAPLNADGTMNVVHYAAWLVRELANANG
jgi:hypothetical protein